MWLVDAVYEYLELGELYFSPAGQDMLNDTFLGLSVVVLGIVYRIDIVSVVLLIICIVLYITFHALLGLCCNLKRPVLDWMNEQVPVKQSMAVMIALFNSQQRIVDAREAKKL